jgi:hypothetical protein
MVAGVRRNAASFSMLVGTLLVACAPGVAQQNGVLPAAASPQTAGTAPLSQTGSATGASSHRFSMHKSAR